MPIKLFELYLLWGRAVQILLIAEQDVSVLEATAVSRFQLILWGSISSLHIARDILTELGRQQATAPIVMLAD